MEIIDIDFNNTYVCIKTHTDKLKRQNRERWANENVRYRVV